MPRGNLPARGKDVYCACEISTNTNMIEKWEESSVEIVAIFHTLHAFSYNLCIFALPNLLQR